MADRDGAEYLIIDIDVTKELEVSFVPRGSNQFSKAILKKSADDEPQPEKTDMLKSVALASLMSTTVGAALAKSFTKDEELDAFLAKDEAGQTADLAAFAKAKAMPFGEETKTADTKKAETIEGDKGNDAIAAAVAKALAESPEFVALKKENDDLKTSLAKTVEGSVTATLEKRAGTEFRGLGLGLPKTVSLLKAMDAITDAEAKTELENILKAHSELVAKTAVAVGLAKLASNQTSATARLNKAAADYAAEHKVSVDDAFVKINADETYADLVAEVDAEEAEARAA